MINKEMWQQLSARLDKQEEMMKNLLVEITKNSVKLDKLKRINEKQTVIAGMPSVTVPDDKSKLPILHTYQLLCTITLLLSMNNPAPSKITPKKNCNNSFPLDGSLILVLFD